MSAGVTVMDVQTASAAVLTWISQALVFGTMVAVLTWLLTRPLRGRSSPRLEMLLWSIVLVKFLVPVGPGWSFSLASICERLAQHAAGGGGVDWAVETGLATGTPVAADPQVHTEAMSAAPPWHWTTIISAAYLLAVVGLVVVRMRSYRAFRARCLALPVADELTRRLVCNVCRRLGVRRVPLIRIDDESRAPFVMGLVRPVLVLSRRHLVRPDEVETVVVHEVIHLRRGDMLVRCLQCIAGTVLFFWPVVGWVNRWIDSAREHACDEWALRHGRLTASEYARCLLCAGQSLPAHRLTYQPACMAGNPSTIERRIDVILALPSRPRRRPVWGLFTVAILFAWGGFTLSGTADAQENTKAEKPNYLATEKDMDLHAKAVYARVNEYAAGDQDGDGVVSKVECWDFVTAMVLDQPQAVLNEYPEADHNKDGKLEFMEAYLFVRGDYEIEEVQKKAQGAITAAKKAGESERAKEIKGEMAIAGIEAWHFILDRRDQLLDMMDVEPSIEEVTAVAHKIAKIEAKRGGKGTLDERMAKIAGLEKKAAGLRTKAAEISGEEAADCEAKAEQLEQKAAEMAAKLTAGLNEKIAKLEAAGQQEKAAGLRAKLAELEED